MPVLVATLGEAVGGLAILAAVYGALALVFVALGRFARRMWRRNEIPQTVLARIGQLVICVLAAAGLPIVGLAFIATGCPPHATECL